MAKIKVAHITKTMPMNGISTVIKNYCLNLDKSQFEITIFTGDPVADYYVELYKDAGIKVIRINESIKRPGRFYVSLYQHLKKEHYDIAHIHGNSATISVELMIAKLSGIKVRAAHSHNSTCTHMAEHLLLKPLFARLYTEAYACSEMAGKWMFEECPFSVVPNGFDTKRFVYSEMDRQSVRDELGIRQKYVLATVARFNDQKNHPLLLKIFEKVAEKREDAVLVLVGDGPNLNKVQELISQHPYRDRIIYYGTTSQVEKIYSAADVFVLPSKYEGLGIVFIEAQINGLPVVTSDQVPAEVNITGHTKFYALTDEPEKWAQGILDCEPADRNDFYNEHSVQIMQYDIVRNAKDLGGKYQTAIKRVER